MARKPAISSPPTTSVRVVPRVAPVPRSLTELLGLPPEDLEKLDLALINLLTAEGLHGSESLKIEDCLVTLDEWTRRVDREVKRNYHRFLARPVDYNHSEAEFRMGMLITVIQQDFQARYSPGRASPQIRGEWERDDVFYADSREVFIHGLLLGQRTGTCSSLPVLYAAVAQRLGWPVHLAATKGHWFVRYQEGDRHVNIEGSGEGFNIYPDEYYKTWPFPTTEEEIKAQKLLQPLSMSEVFGSLLVIRAGNLKSANRLEESAETWRRAMRYLPDSPELRKVVGFAQIRAQESRDRERWDALWNEVGQLPIPDGPHAVALKNRKARVQFYMARSTHLATIESEVRSLKDDLDEYTSALAYLKDSAVPILSAPLVPMVSPLDVPAETGFVLIRNNAGKVMMIPAERIPAGYRHGVPPDLLATIAAMGDEAEMEAELWLHYRRQAGRDSAKRIHIPQDRIPSSYWNGLPAELEERLRYDTDPEVIIAKLWAFHAEEINRMSRSPIGFAQTNSGSLSPCPSCRRFHLPGGSHIAQRGSQSIDPMRLPAEYQRSLPADLVRRLQGQSSEWEIMQEVRNYQQGERRERAPAPSISLSGYADQFRPEERSGRRIEIVPTTHDVRRGTDLPLTPQSLQPINPAAAGQKGNP